jgi:biopolymer transport protein ExbD
MRLLITAILLSVAVTLVCSAQTSHRHPIIVEVDVSSARNVCLIGNAEIPCGKVGSKLRALKVPLDAEIDVRGDTSASFPLAISVLESLTKAGYATKVAHADVSVSN